MSGVTELRPDDLGLLKLLLQPVAGYWIAIADQLGMTSCVATIQATPGNISPSDSLRDLLHRWLNQGRPSLEKLCQALRKDGEIIGGAGVADKLEEKLRDQRGMEKEISIIPYSPNNTTVATHGGGWVTFLRFP